MNYVVLKRHIQETFRQVLSLVCREINWDWTIVNLKRWNLSWIDLAHRMNRVFIECQPLWPCNIYYNVYIIVTDAENMKDPRFNDRSSSWVPTCSIWYGRISEGQTLLQIKSKPEGVFVGCQSHCAHVKSLRWWESCNTPTLHVESYIFLSSKFSNCFRATQRCIHWKWVRLQCVIGHFRVKLKLQNFTRS